MRYQINKREYVNLMTHCRNSAESYDGKRMDLLEALEGTHAYWHGEAADTLRCELRAYLESGEYDGMLREYRRVECELELLLPEIRFQMDLQDRMSLLLSGQHKAEPEELYLDMEMQEEMLDDLAEIDRQINSSVNEAINAMSDIADIVDLSCDMKDLREKQEDLSNVVRQYSMMADENMHGVGKLDLFLCGLFDFLPKNDSSENDNGEGGSEENLPTVYLDLSDTYWLIKDISNTYPELTREQIDVLKRIDRRVKALMPDLSMDDRKCIILEIINGSKKSELEKIYRTCCYSSRDYEILMDNMLKYILGPRNYPVDVWLEDASDMNIALADSYTRYDINRGMRLLYDNHVAYLDALLALCENKGDNTGNADQEYHDKLELLISVIEKSDLLEADIRDGKTFYEAMDQEMPMYIDTIMFLATVGMDNSDKSKVLSQPKMVELSSWLYAYEGEPVISENDIVINIPESVRDARENLRKYGQDKYGNILNEETQDKAVVTPSVDWYSYGECSQLVLDELYKNHEEYVGTTNKKYILDGKVAFDDEGRYLIALGPRMIMEDYYDRYFNKHNNSNLNNCVGADEIGDYWNKNFDVVLKNDETGELVYIECSIADVKEHTGPGNQCDGNGRFIEKENNSAGCFQTGVPYWSKDLNGFELYYSGGSYVEFCGSPELNEAGRADNGNMSKYSFAYLVIHSEE